VWLRHPCGRRRLTLGPPVEVLAVVPCRVSSCMRRSGPAARELLASRWASLSTPTRLARVPFGMFLKSTAPVAAAATPLTAASTAMKNGTAASCRVVGQVDDVEEQRAEEHAERERMSIEGTAWPATRRLSTGRVFSGGGTAVGAGSVGGGAAGCAVPGELVREVPAEDAADREGQRPREADPLAATEPTSRPVAQ
jgi:hypothetical protein